MSTFTTATARALGVPALLTTFALGLALAMPVPAGAQTSTVSPTQTQAPSAAPAAPATPAPRARTGRRGGTRGIEARIADLHKRLKITAAQEAQWKQVADIMRQNAADVEAAIKDRIQNRSTMNAMENLNSYQKVAQAHDAGLQRLIPAFQTLYDSMSDAQKKNADEVFRAFGQRRGRPTHTKKSG